MIRVMKSLDGTVEKVKLTDELIADGLLVYTNNKNQLVSKNETGYYLVSVKAPLGMTGPFKTLNELDEQINENYHKAFSRRDWQMDLQERNRPFVKETE